jgi:hypothetical protein
MSRVGQHAEFIDRCAPLSISDRVMLKKLQQLSPDSQSNVTAISKAARRIRKRQAAPAIVAAE